MNKEQALQQIEELKKFVEHCDKKELRTPDNILFELVGDKLEIVFLNKKQTLCWNYSYNVWRVGTHWAGYAIKNLRLEKVNREDLKVGEVAFRTNGDSSDFDNFAGYCVIVNSEEVVYVTSNSNVLHDSYNYEKWYRVVRD